MVKFTVFMIAFFLGAIVFSLFAYSQEAMTAITGIVEVLPEPPPVKMPWWFELIRENIDSYPTIAGWLFSMLAGINFLLRGISEILGFVAQKTESKKDDKVFAIVHKSSYWVGLIAGWFGVGKPRTFEAMKK